MKNFLILFIFTVLISSCSMDSEISNSEVNGEWELIKMQGMLYDPSEEEKPLSHQETYHFKSDGSFTKTRIDGQGTRKASGTFVVSDYEKGYYQENYLKLITLTYPSENDLIANCSYEPEEHLILTEDHRLISTAQACDYPSLVFEKKR